MIDINAMDRRRRRMLQSLMAAALPAGWSGGSLATPPWPPRPLRRVVGFPPGSSPDALARTVADPLSRALGQPVIVDNKPGAGGTIGVDAVAKASDGHTIGLTGNGPLTTAKLLNSKLPFDVARDLRPISLVASSPFVLVAGSANPATDLPALVAYARAKGERLNYGSIGLGTGSHLTMELLKSLTGIRPVHIPFSGFPQVVTAIIGGEIDLAFLVPSIAVPQARSGRLRIYGTSSASRVAAFSEIPPIAEVLRLPGFDVAAWNGIFGPASMPPANVLRLAQEITAIVKSPETRQRLFDQGWQALGTAPEGMARKIREDTRVWGDIIRLTGIRRE